MSFLCVQVFCLYLVEHWFKKKSWFSYLGSILLLFIWLIILAKFSLWWLKYSVGFTQEKKLLRPLSQVSFLSNYAWIKNCLFPAFQQDDERRSLSRKMKIKVCLRAIDMQSFIYANINIYTNTCLLILSFPISRLLFLEEMNIPYIKNWSLCLILLSWRGK